MTVPTAIVAASTAVVHGVLSSPDRPPLSLDDVPLVVASLRRRIPSHRLKGPDGKEQPPPSSASITVKQRHLLAEIQFPLADSDAKVHLGGREAKLLSVAQNDHNPRSQNQLLLNSGDKISNITPVDDVWCMGELTERGDAGLFPRWKLYSIDDLIDAACVLHVPSAQVELAWRCIEATGGFSENKPLGAQMLCEAAIAKDMDGVTGLGIALEGGHGIPIDPQLAVAFYKISATLGHPVGQSRLADCYIEGVGVLFDPSLAIYWCQKASEQTYSWAYATLAELYEKGRGTPRNEKLALYYYLLASRQNALARLHVGRCYEHGIGTEQDTVKAAEYYDKIKEIADPDSLSDIAERFEDGEGVEKDLDRAFKMQTMAAEMDCSWAKYRLAFMYRDGIGVEADSQLAQKWFLKAAELGHSDAQVEVANYYRWDESNHAMAQQWYERAIAQGSVDAKLGLAELYRYSEQLTRPESWHSLYKEAVEADHFHAMMPYAEVLEYELNEYEAAIKWLQLAELHKDANEAERGVAAASLKGLIRRVFPEHTKKRRLP